MQCLESQLAAGSHGCRPTDPAEQRDLAEPLPRTERVRRRGRPRSPRLARLDHEVAVADVALAEDDVAGGHVDRLPAREQAARWRATAGRSAWPPPAASRSRDRARRWTGPFARSRCHDATAQTGHSRPTITSAGRTPARSITTEATIAPTPMDRATRLSRTPKTRASTSSAASLARSVNPARSISALPTPTHASRPNAATCCGKTPISVTGTPHRATPTATRRPNAECRPAATQRANPGPHPPRWQRSRTPTPGSPVPSRSMATTTVSTVSAPRVNDCAAARPMMRARSPLRLTTRIPSTAELTRLVRSGRMGAEARRTAAAAAGLQPTTRRRPPQRTRRSHL